MNIQAVIRLLVTLCMALDVPAELVAEFYDDDDACQQYYNKILEAQTNGAKIPVL